MNPEFTFRLEKIERVLHKYLPSQADDSWKSLSFGKLDSSVNESHLANLIGPCLSLVDLGGKRWRPLLLVLCAESVLESKNSSGSDLEKRLSLAYSATPLVEFSHTASLIHDDIEDSADMRRGKPASHITYGLDVALNAGSWLYFEASSCIQNLILSDSEKLRLYELFLSELRRLHLGQAMDILWHRNPELIPSVQEYEAMVKNKTGTLSRMAVKIGAFLGGASQNECEEAGKIAENLGTGFQIIDDVINLTTGNPGKKRGDDIVEGKKSLPVLLYLEKNPQNKEKLISLFKKASEGGIDSPSVEEAISLLSESGAVEEAKNRGNEIIAKNSVALSSLFSDSSSKSSLLIKELFDSLQKKAG